MSERYSGDYYNRKDKRKRSTSPPRSRQHSRYSEPTTSTRTSSKPETDKIIDWYDFKQDLHYYLESNFNIKDTEDFFRFYTKYLAAHRMKITSSNKSTLDRNKLFPINFSKPTHILYEKFPLYKRNGNKLPSNQQSFDILIEAIKTYQDFQQKTKFQKLRQLRKTQAELPIAAFKKEIVKELQIPGVLLIAGDTGCGKSTQLPQYVLEAGFKRVAVTQPRRIACVSLANRVAFETLSSYKHKVGFQIRFEKHKNKNTNVIFLTEGILLRQAADGDVLKGYDCIVLDEVHERHLNMDFLVGIMKCLLNQKNHNLKLVLMSATINLELFQTYFETENVKTLVVPGRLYPIEIIYKPVLKDVYDKKRRDTFDSQPYLNILELIDSKYKPNQKGDVLIFLQGLKEIQKLSSAIQDYAESKKNWIVLNLHSSLSLEEQDKVFYQAPENVRKCIVSTNIAETSVTIDGVRFVIDSGKCNRMLYERCGVNRLFTTDISQDSAKQRSGRAGRTGPGYCYRLFSEEDLSKFEVYTPGEIHLVPLENLVLNMVTLGLSDVHKFPFLEKPTDEKLVQAVERLLFLEALNKMNNTCDPNVKDTKSLGLTVLGDAMSKLPVDLTIGKMLITSTIFGVIDAALTLASLMSVQPPLNENRFYDTKESRDPYVSNHGEPITLLNLYKGWLEVKLEGSYHAHESKESSRKWCRARGVEEQRFYEVTKLVQQFREILQDAELIPKFEQNLTSRERQQRHGELKQLKRLRLDLKNDKNSNKKRLKHKSLYNNDSDDDGESKHDIKDVEFRIVNDFTKVKTLLSQTKTDSFKDLMLLKVLLTAALYPQIAVEDEFNSSKTVNERLYHTKYKNYVFLRPTSYFAENPEFFNLPDSDVEVPPVGYFSKKPLSTKHQVLVFQKLLETKKTYLMNVYRMPALQTLLLFGRNLCVNRVCTKLCVDDFLYIEIPNVNQGLKLVLEAVKLRQSIKVLLEKQLQSQASGEVDKVDSQNLLDRLIKFMSTTPVYNVKRLLNADVKVIYTFDESDCAVSDLKENPFCKDFVPIKNEDKGGVNVTEHVVWDCLPMDQYDVDVEMSLLQAHCEKCNNVQYFMSMWDFVLHSFVKCDSLQSMENSIETATTTVNEIKVAANGKSYKCEKCKQTLVLSPVDYLKHKKYCVPVKQEKL